jgi:hypothetical protein
MEGLGIEKVGIFYGHSEYITAIWCLLLVFGNFVNGIFLHFPRFGILC